MPHFALGTTGVIYIKAASDEISRIVGGNATFVA